MDAFKYKHFLLRALSKTNLKESDNADLAKLADESIYESSFNPHELNLLKIGTGYAMETFLRKIEDNSDTNDLIYDDLEDMKRIIDNVVSAGRKKEISDLIDEFMAYEIKYLHKEKS